MIPGLNGKLDLNIVGNGLGLNLNQKSTPGTNDILFATCLESLFGVAGTQMPATGLMDLMSGLLPGKANPGLLGEQNLDQGTSQPLATGELEKLINWLSQQALPGAIPVILTLPASDNLKAMSLIQNDPSHQSLQINQVFSSVDNPGLMAMPKSIVTDAENSGGLNAGIPDLNALPQAVDAELMAMEPESGVGLAKASAYPELADQTNCTTPAINPGFEKQAALIPLLQFISAADLEKLTIGQSITLAQPANTKLESGSITFTKDNQSQQYDDNAITPLIVEFKNADSAIKLNAFLISDAQKASLGNVSPGESQANLNNLASLIEKSGGRDAKLVLFVPEQEITRDLIENGLRPDPSANKILEPLMADTSKPAKMILGIERVDLGLRIPKPDSIVKSDGQIMPGGNSDETGQLNEIELPQVSAPENADDPINSGHKGFDYRPLTRKLGTENAPAFSERLSGTPWARLAEASLAKNPANSENIFEPKKVAFPEQVNFKLELPRNGTGLPEGGYFRIKIEPEYLGKVDVHLKVEGNQLQARLEVNSVAAKQAVEANLPGLKEALHNNGIKVESIVIDITTGGQHNQATLADNHAANQYRNKMLSHSHSDSLGEEDSDISGIAHSGGIVNLKGTLNLLA